MFSRLLPRGGPGDDHGRIHGFGFASALTGAGLPRADLPLALLGFDVGVEIGQVAVVLLVPAISCRPR